MTTNIESFRPELKRSRFLGLNLACPIEHWLYTITAISGKYGPSVAGNSSTTEIQALGLSLQIDRYDGILAKRTAAATYLLNFPIQKMSDL